MGGLEQLEQRLVVHLVEVVHLLVLEVLLLHLHLLLYDVLLRHLGVHLTRQHLLLLRLLLSDLLGDLLVRQTLRHDLLLGLHLVLRNLLRDLSLLLVLLLLERGMLGLMLLRIALLSSCNGRLNELLLLSRSLFSLLVCVQLWDVLDLDLLLGNSWLDILNTLLLLL